MSTDRPIKLFFQSFPISNKFRERVILVENVRFNNLFLFRNKPVKYVSLNTFSNTTVGMWRVYYKEKTNI